MNLGTRDQIRKRKQEEDDDMMLFLLPALYLGSSGGSEKREEKETKKSKKSANVIAECMARYIDMREKQFELESAQLASASKDGDFSIRKCTYVLKSMELTKEEKAKAFEVFKNADNRKIFLTCSEDDEETTLIWLRDAMAKLI